MGSKSGGNSAPAPDPRLVEAQLRSMGVQEDAIGRLLKTTEELQPLQKQQLQFGLDSAKTAYDQSQQDRQWSLGRRDALTSAQDSVAADAEAFDTEARREELAGQAQADVAQQFGAVREQQNRDLARRGVNPASGMALATQEKTQTQQALASVGAANVARTQARTEGRALKRGVADMLAGYPGMASGQAGQGAQVGASGVTIANQGAGGLTAGSGQAAGAAGQLGQNATSMFGQQSAHYANSYQPSSLGSTMGGIGSVLGGAAQAWKAFSDPRLKTAIVPVGKDQRTGLVIYEFAYLSDPSKRFRGVMADEVQNVMPAAVSTAENGFLQVDYGLLGIPFEEVAHG